MTRAETGTSKQTTRQHGAFSVDLDGREFSFLTQPGVFSQDALDLGTRCLIDAVLPAVKPHMTVLDLGAGVGVIGIILATRASRGEVWMVDTDVRAARLSERNIERNHIPNAHVVLGDITLDLPPDLRFDLVVSNPPTHSGKEVLQSFVTESYEVLRPGGPSASNTGGSLYLVVNRLLSAKRMMEETFGAVETVERCKGFLVLRSQKVRRGRDATAR